MRHEPQMSGFTDLFGTALDILSGGPQKRARQARDELRAAQAQRDAIFAQARSATEIARIQAEQQQVLLRTLGIYGVVGLGALLVLKGGKRR